MEKRYFWLVAAILYCIAIFITTASPASTGGSTFSFFQQWFHLSEEAARLINVIFRKMVHLVAFGILAILFYNSFIKRRYLTAWLLTTLYAATDELHQVFIPERTGSIIDVGIDSLGATIALLIVYSYHTYRRHSYERKDEHHT